MRARLLQTVPVDLAPEGSFGVHGTVPAMGAGGIPVVTCAGASVTALGEVGACGQRERGGQIQRLSLGVTKLEVLTVLGRAA